MSADGLKVVEWYVHASFAVHPDLKSHTGAIMNMVQEEMQSVSRKQKLHTRSSTKTESVAVYDASF